MSLIPQLGTPFPEQLLTPCTRTPSPGLQTALKMERSRDNRLSAVLLSKDVIEFCLAG